MMHPGADVVDEGGGGGGGGGEEMAGPRTLFIIEAENEALRAEVASLKQKIKDMDHQHLQETNKLLYRLLKADERNAALEGGESVNSVDKEVGEEGGGGIPDEGGAKKPAANAVPHPPSPSKGKAFVDRKSVV